MKAGVLCMAVAALTALGGVVWPVSAQAQVAVGPGFVVAPCVRVEWDCGRVHVCAPFVNITVDCARCCGCRPRCCENTASTGAYSQSANRLNDHPTRQQLAAAAVKLSQSLQQFQTADSWQRYLALAPDQALSAEQVQQPDSATATNLVSVLRHFDAANRDDQYRVITALPAFQQTHTLLANYLAQQQPSLLSAAVEVPNAALANAAWAKLLPTARSGWAVDTARLPGLNAAPETAVQETVRTPKSTHSSVEELPAPIQKSGI